MDAQKEAGHAFIKSQAHEGWIAVGDDYEDGGFSGGNMDRPALKRLMADIQEGRIDIVVVYKIDRLSRSLADFARMVDVFDRHRVSFSAVTQQINSATSMGRLMLNVLLSFAQFEREVIRSLPMQAHPRFDWVPSSDLVAQSNLSAFIRKTGETSLDALAAHAERDPAWLMQEVMAFCDFRFYAPYTNMLDVSEGIEHAAWCTGATTNIVLNCLDKHRGTPTWDKIYLVWEGENPTAQRTLSYREFDSEVCRLASALTQLGIERGDRVGLFMPNLPETFLAFFAVLKIGGIVLPLFSGFGPQPIVSRLNDGEAKAVLTVDGTWRRGAPGLMKPVLDEALKSVPSVQNVLVLRHLAGAAECAMQAGRDHDWAQAIAHQPTELATAEMQAEAPAVLLSRVRHQIGRIAEFSDAVRVKSTS